MYEFIYAQSQQTVVPKVFIFRKQTCLKPVEKHPNALRSFEVVIIVKNWNYCVCIQVHSYVCNHCNYIIATEKGCYDKCILKLGCWFSPRQLRSNPDEGRELSSVASHYKCL